jgi:hypothetical protein
VCIGGRFRAGQARADELARLRHDQVFLPKCRFGGVGTS